MYGHLNQESDDAPVGCFQKLLWNGDRDSMVRGLDKSLDIPCTWKLSKKNRWCSTQNQDRIWWIYGLVAGKSQILEHETSLWLDSTAWFQTWVGLKTWYPHVPLDINGCPHGSPAGRPRVAGQVAVRNGRRDPNWRNNVGLLIRWLHPDGTWRHVQIDCGKTFRESVMLWYKEHQAGWGWGKIYEIWIMNEKYRKISPDISALKKKNNKTIIYS